MNARLLIAAGLCLPVSLNAGVFTFSASQFMDNVMNTFGPFPDLVTHPPNYDPVQGGVVTVRVCIANGSANRAAMMIPVQNVIDRLNQSVAVTPNLKLGADNELAAGEFDFESVALHELGHCLGLAHPNAASESCDGPGDGTGNGLCSADESNFTKALPGPDLPLAGNEASLEGDAGTDTVPGSPDDLRGDDVNLHYFEIGINNPFIAPDIVDAVNYRRDLADLPQGDNFAANADRIVGQTTYGVVNTEAVMQQGTAPDETQRALAADDLATLGYARTGTDRMAGMGSDDYAVDLVLHQGNPNLCDVTIEFDDAETGFAVCQSSATLNVGQAGQEAAFLQTGNIFFNDTNSWFFSTTRIPEPGADQAVVARSGTTMTVNGGVASLLGNDTHPDALVLILSTSAFGGPDHGSVMLNTDGAFSYTHNGDAATEDRFVYEVCVDGQQACSHGVVSVTISDSGNLPPIAMPDSIIVDEGGAATALIGGGTSVLDNDNDPEMGTLIASSTPVSGPANGALTLNADGTFEYLHNGSESTSDQFVYEVCDDDAAPACAEGTVSISITAVNDPPIAVDDELLVPISGTVTMTIDGADNLLANDSDPDSSNFIVTLQGAPADGNATVNTDGTFSYTHTGTAPGTDSFTYQVCDLSLAPACAPATVNITISGNAAPEALDDALSVDEGGTATTLDSMESSLLANDSDPDGDMLTLSVMPVAPPANGSLTLNAGSVNGAFEYVHDGSATTTDSFIYEVCDDGSPIACSQAAVAVTINPLNDPPTAMDDAIEVLVGRSTTMTAAGSDNLLANDSDPDSMNLSATLLTPATDGDAVVNTDGSFSYTHTGTATGSDSFEYEVCDDAPAPACDTGLVMVSIVSNRSPVAVDDSMTVDEGGSTTMLDSGASVLDNDRDPDAGQTLAVSTTPVMAPQHGILALNANGTLAYFHDGSETVEDSIVYEVCDDGTPPACAEATITITVNPINDPPIATDDQLFVRIGGTTSMTVSGEASLLANDSDPDSANLTAVLQTTPADGTATVNPDGTFSYTHTGAATGTDSFTYQACDQSFPMPACVTATVNVTIADNLPPTAVADAITVDQGGVATMLDSGAMSVIANDDDPDGDNALLSVNTTPATDVANGSLTLAADGTFSYSHDGSATSSDNFEYEVCDGGGACSIGVVSITINPTTVMPADFAPCSNRGRRVVVGFAVSIDAASEFTGTGLIFSAAGLPTTLMINSDTGEITGTPFIDDVASSPYSVTVTASDSTEQSFILEVDETPDVKFYSGFEEFCFGL